MSPAPLAALVALALACAEMHKDNEITARSLVARVEPGCVYAGRWHAPGAPVPARDPCLRCACARGALACSRRACAAPPAPSPRCRLLRRAGACCPELQCPDGETSLELEAAPPDHDVEPEHAAGAHDAVCVEEEAVFAAGSALGARDACEQCFCLRGVRRCARERCLAPPAGCRARLAPGACCPASYDCAPTARRHDCEVDGAWVAEGARAPAAEAAAGGCARCHCLRGAVHCVAPSCALPAPPRGCTPLLRAGHCCPQRYRCDHPLGSEEPVVQPISDNFLLPVTADHRSFHTSESHSHVSTAKVKRKTGEPPPAAPATSSAPAAAAEPGAPTEAATAALTTSALSTEQPMGSVRIVINGTINCTAELSSASLPLNASVGPDPAASADDLITERTDPGEFDGDETFTITVTSSLRTNTSRSTPAPASTPAAAAPAAGDAAQNKPDYDYDYAEPTLPPSLPNLKIIPFVAADAVLEDDMSAKDVLTYPMSEREDKFPVYYPSGESKGTRFATRREDVYQPTQYPVFVSKRTKPAQYPARTQPGASAGPPASGHFETQMPADNLFSPPVETEGGFIPKAPGVADEYYVVFPSTSVRPSAPQLTTSVQLNTGNSEEYASPATSARPMREPEDTDLEALPAPGEHGAIASGAVGDSEALPAPGERGAIAGGDPEALPTPGERGATAGGDSVTLPTPGERVADTSLVEHDMNTPPVTEPTDHRNIAESANTEAVHLEPTAASVEPAPPAPALAPAPASASEDEDEDEEEDEGFPFGSVLKLLLSDSFIASTEPPRATAPPVRHSGGVTRAPAPAPADAPTVPPFIPIPHHPHKPPALENVVAQNTVSRIDHLVLGEATAIRNTPPPPVPAPAPAVASGAGAAGLLKLAGCNIYGRMYRVGGSIAELSAPCQECRCTELGVTCRPRPC